MLVVHLAECGMLARTPVNVDSLSCHSVASRIRRRRSHMVEGCDVLDVLDERVILVWRNFIQVPVSHLKLTPLKWRQ